MILSDIYEVKFNDGRNTRNLRYFCFLYICIKYDRKEERLFIFPGLNPELSGQTFNETIPSRAHVTYVSDMRYPISIFKDFIDNYTENYSDDAYIFEDVNCCNINN